MNSSLPELKGTLSLLLLPVQCNVAEAKIESQSSAQKAASHSHGCIMDEQDPEKSCDDPMLVIHAVMNNMCISVSKTEFL